MIRAAVLALLPLAARAGTVEITVTNLRAATGHMRVEVCTEARFAKDVPCEHRAEAQAAQPATVIRLENVPPGVYGAQGYYDEKDWKELRRDFIGRPKQGVGFSRDAPIRFAPPKFSDAQFTVGAEGVTRVAMTLRYF